MNNVYAQPNLNECPNFIEYKVEMGDKLESIAEHFGSSEFASLIKSENMQAFNQSDSIHSEAVLKIPHKIYHFKDSQWSIQEVLKQPFCDNQKISSLRGTLLESLAQDQTTDTTETDQLQEFRKAFESLIEKQRTSEQEEAQAQAEQQIFLELDGLVMDETRSKIGRDFYDIFFQQWVAPPNSNNFTIVISEQPTPSLGSMVSVTVNGEQIFRYRLQPRYEVIEQVATYAVRFTHNYMQENKHQYKIY